MPKLIPCFDKLPEDEKNYLQKKTASLMSSGVSEDDAPIQAVKEFMEENLDNLHDVYNKLGIEGYERPISSIKKEKYDKKIEQQKSSQSSEGKGGKEGKQQAGKKIHEGEILLKEKEGEQPSPSFFESAPSKEKMGFDEFRKQALAMFSRPLDKWDWRINSDLSTKERQKGVEDIASGKDSSAARKIEAAIKDMHDKGIIPMNRGVGPQSQIRDWTFEEMGMMQDAIKGLEPHIEDWLRGETELSPEQEQFISDNIDNLIQDYETEPTGENKQPPTETEASGGEAAGTSTGRETGTTKESAEAFRASAERIRVEDPEGAKLLEEAADRIDSGEPPPKEPKTEKDQKEPEPTVSITNAAVNESRLHSGLKPVVKEARKRFGQTWKDASDRVLGGNTDPRNYVAHLFNNIASVPSMTFGDIDNAIILMDRIDLSNQKRLALDDYNKALKTGNDNVEALAFHQLSDIEQKIQQNDVVADKVGTAQGRALSSRRLLAYMDYSLAPMKRDIAKLYGTKEVPADVLHRLEKIEADHAEALKKLEVYEQKWKDQQAADAYKKEVNKNKKEKVADDQVVRKSLADRIRKLKPPPDLTFADPLLAAKTWGLLVEGVAKLVEAGETIAKAIDKFLEESGFKFKSDKDEKIFRDYMGAVKEPVPLKDRMTEKISELAKNAGAESITQEMITPLRRLINDYARNGEEDFNKVLNDVHKELKDSFTDLTKEDIRDAYSGYGDVRLDSKQELQNKVREWKKEATLLAQMDDVLSGKTPHKRELGERSKESDKIDAMRKDLERKMKDAGISWTNPPNTPEEKHARALQSLKTRLQTEINNLTSAIENKKDVPGREGVKLDDQAKALKEQRDALKDTLNHVLGKEGKKTLTDAERTERAEKYLNTQIENLAKDIEAIKNKTYKGEEKTAVPENITLQLMRGRRDALRELKKKLLIDTSDKSNEAAIALEKYKDSIRKRLLDYGRRLEEQDFEDKRDKKSFQNDAEARKLELEQKRAETAFKQEKVNAERANRTRLQKIYDRINQWKRFSVLTGIPTIGKLMTAVAYRTVFNPIEEITGVLLHAIPGVSALSKLAPREGGGINLKAEGLALKEWTRADNFADAMRVAKEGLSELDHRFGKYVSYPPETLEVMGRIHGALKNFVKRSEFARSYEKRMQHAIDHGADPADELAQLTAMSGAYEDATRSIFMQDNWLVNKFNDLLRSAERSKKFGPETAAAITRFLLPIVKIPTNFVAESTNYAFGSVRVFELFARHLNGSLKDLSPDEADSLMRSLKKGTIGASAMALGFFMPGIGGGYYIQGGKKANENDPDWGELEIAGVRIPRWATHFPLFECIQLGSTMRRVMDSDIKKHKTPITAVTDGVLKSSRGMVGEVPLFHAPEELTEAIQQGDIMNKFVYPELGSNIPIVLHWTAGKMDTPSGFDLLGEPIKRKPMGFEQQMEYRLPGLRQNVPTPKEQKEEQRRIKENESQY